MGKGNNSFYACKSLTWDKLIGEGCSKKPEWFYNTKLIAPGTSLPLTNLCDVAKYKILALAPNMVPHEQPHLQSQEAMSDR